MNYGLFIIIMEVIFILGFVLAMIYCRFPLGSTPKQDTFLVCLALVLVLATILMFAFATPPHVAGELS